MSDESSIEIFPLKMRGEGYEPVYTSTIEEFYSCFTTLNRSFYFIVLSMSFIGFADWRG